MLLVAAIVVGAISVHLACGALAYAIRFAYFQRKFPRIAEPLYLSDRLHSLLYGVTLGPIGLIVALHLSGGARHGLKWR